MTFLPIQIEHLTSLKDYGLPGIIILMLVMALVFLFKILYNIYEGYRKSSEESNKAFVDLVTKQNETNSRIADITEKIADQNQHFHENLSKKMDDLPLVIMKEFEFRQLQANQMKPPTA